MTLPDSYTQALLLAILSMICWGSWANTQKLTGKWRFELFCFDYAIGVAIAMLVAALTFGSIGFDGLTFSDELLIGSKRKMIYALGSGVIFNLANMLLVAAISIAGMAVAFPVGIGLAFVIGVVLNYSINPQGNAGLLFSGALLVAAAIVFCSLAYRELARQRSMEAITSGQTRSTKVGTGTKGLLVSVIAGVLMGFFYPLVELAKAGDTGIGPYTIGFLFGLGVLGSTLVFNVYFMNLPIEGEPIGLKPYFTAPKSYHLWAILGGVVWAIGGASNFIASSAPQEVQVGPAISYAVGQGATMISALWGVFVWREFAGAPGRAKILLGLMFALFLAGLVLVSMAPLYAAPVAHGG